MILLWWSTWRSGCAASMPSRASTTTSFGSLISFFMTSLSRGACRSSGRGRGDGRLGIGEVDALADSPVGGRVRDEAVGQGRERTGEELGAQVDRELLPLDGPAGDLLDEHRAEGAGRVDGRAGGRGHGDDR